MNVYVCNVGSSLEAVVSGFWSLIDNYNLDIDRIVFVCSRDTCGFCDLLFRVFRVICPLVEDYGLIVVDEADVYGSSCKIIDFLRGEFGGSCNFIFDVTPGRKTMSISLFRVGLKFDCPVIYFHLKSNLFRGFVYPLIPRPLCRLEVIHGKLERFQSIEVDDFDNDYVRVPYRYLIAILNRLYSFGGSNFTVIVPYVNLRLFSFDYDDLSRVNIEFSDYQIRMINRYLSKFTYDYVYDSLLTSGLISPVNIDEVIGKIVNLIGERSCNLILNPRQIALALDTNMLYLKIISNYFIDRFNVPPLIVSSIVRSEIQRWIDRRLSSSEVARYLSYCKLINYPINRARRLFNKLFSEDCRRAIIALLELIELEKLNLVNYVYGEGVGDEALINNYSSLTDKFNLILLTCDRGILNRALLAKLPAILIEQRRSGDLKFNLNYGNLSRILYILSLYYGSIKISSGVFSFEFNGFWRDWNINDLGNGYIEVLIDPSNPVLRGLSGKFRVIGEVEKLLKEVG